MVNIPKMLYYIIKEIMTDCTDHNKSNYCNAPFLMNKDHHESDVCSKCLEHADTACQDCIHWEHCTNKNQNRYIHKLIFNKMKKGAPKKYKNKMQILHTLEAEMLGKLDRIAEYKRTRTDLINEGIELIIAKYR